MAKLSAMSAALAMAVMASRKFNEAVPQAYHADATASEQVNATGYRTHYMRNYGLGNKPSGAARSKRQAAKRRNISKRMGK